MKLFSQTPRSLPQPQLDKFYSWLFSQECDLFIAALRSRIADVSAGVIENHCDFAEEFLSTGRQTSLDTDCMKQIARFAICIKVIDEMKQLVSERMKSKETAVEVIKSLDIEI